MGACQHRCRCRRPVAESRDAQAPATRARRAGGRSHTAGCQRSPGDDLGVMFFGDRGPAMASSAHPCRRRACETGPGLTSKDVAGLLATGCGLGSGKRPRDAMGGSLPIGSHYV